MDKSVYLEQRNYLLDRISFNELIKCHRVANKYRRMLAELDKKFNSENKRS